MYNIFSSKKVSKSLTEKSISWLIAFSVVLQTSSVLPLTAYATVVPVQPMATIIATKIVCDNESDLPNWGAGGPNITQTTATQFLATHPNCRAQSDWKFQSGPSTAANPGDNTTTIAGAPWATSPATNAVGVTTWTAPVVTVGSSTDRIWVREVMDALHIPFTGVGTSANISAELYCHNDVYNYDNYDYIANPAAGQTYHCVGFNVLKATPPSPACILGEAVSGEWSKTAIQQSVSEKSLQTILTESGYVAVSAANDQSNLESWKTATVGSPANVEVTLLAKHAANLQNLGYYTGGTLSTFTTLFSVPTTTNGTSLTFSVPANTTFGIALDTVNQSGVHTKYATQNSLNSDPMKHSVVYYPATGEYVVAFEDLPSTSSDKDYNDLVIRMKVKDCGTPPPPPPPPPNPKCSDGIDNDGDGKIDFPLDLGCDTPNDNDENQKPVITPRGTSPQQVTLGDTYTEPSADVDDAEDGDIDAKLVTTGVVNTSVLGAYIITYNATDSQNLPADAKTHTVNVVAACSDGKDNDEDLLADFPLDLGCSTPDDNDENTKPVITLDGANPLELTQNGTFTEPGFSANDAEDGAIPNVNVVVTGTVDTSTVGTYTLSYNVVDSKSLAADTKTRTVKVNPPLTECNDGIDNDGDSTVDFGSDAGCDNPEDNDENQPPVITVVGADPLEVTLGGVYSDPGRTAADPEDLDITTSIVDSGDTVNTAVLGVYVVKYNVTDSKGLSAIEKSRTVKVVTSCSDGRDNDGDTLVDYPLDPACSKPEDDSENSRPVISLLGDVVMSIVQGSIYMEPSATVADAEEGDITSKLLIAGTVDGNTVGTYTITYNATDSKELAADTKSRTINVTTPVCTSNCGGGGAPAPVCSDGGDNDGDALADYPRDPGCDSPQDNDEYNAPTPPPPPPGGGGGPISLTIMNEKVVSTGTTTVLVTWNTNLPADGRVAYGLDPIASLGSAPLYGYSLTTATDTTLTTTHSVNIEGVPSAVSAYFRPISVASAQTAVGIELTRGGVLGESTECFYLKEYMRLGANNNPVEVTKLQSFLRNFEGFDKLEVNGFFDIETDKAVRAFQDKYSADVLSTWNLPTNTGYVYYTTQKKINEIYCQRAFPLSTDQLVEIASFRTVVRTQAEVATTPTIAASATQTNTLSVEPSLGIVAGASTISLSSESSTMETPSTSTARRGHIALADLLATSPTLGEKLASTKTEPTITVEPITNDKMALANDGTEEIAATGIALKEKSRMSNITLIAGALLIITLTALATLYVRGRKTAVVVEMGE